MYFPNRQQAGRILASKLTPYITKSTIVYALPRGGVPLGVEIATHFSLPFDLVIPRKIGHRINREYAICAVTERGNLVCNEDERRQEDAQWIQKRADEERQEAKRRRDIYCKGKPRLTATNKTAILVDDGIATGLTMLAAIDDIKIDKPEHIIVAVPVAPKDTIKTLENTGVQVVAALVPDFFMGGVGAYYRDFEQLSDDDVLTELSRLG